MWFLYQLDPGSPLYNVSVTLCLSGGLDASVLERSLASLVRRHESLRTTFRLVDGKPAQLVDPACEVPLSILDLAAEPDAEAAFYRAAQAALLQPFDLETGPVWRAHLYRLAPLESRLLLVMHHIISDGWSVSVLAKELAAVYGALAAGRPVTLPALPIQCADFAIWQRHWLQGDRLNNLLAYWQKQLAGAPVALDLPADRPRPPEQTFKGARLPFQLDDTINQALKRLSRAEGVTLFMVLFAAFTILLSRLSGQKDLVVGTPITNRSQPETLGLVGVFVNTLPLRIDLSGDLTYRQLLQRVRQVALDGYAHEAMPFARLVDMLKLERSLSHSPLFQVSFGLQDNPLKAIEMPGLTVELLEVRSLLQEGSLPPLNTGMAMFSLTFHLSEIAQGVGGWIEYNSDLFEQATVLRLAEQYQALLAGVVANPDQRLSLLPLLTAEARQQLIVDWNATDRPLAPAVCLPTLFENEARRRPHRIALKQVARSGRAAVELSYQALNERANQLAHYLRQQGVGPETLVGVCAERSAAMVVAILGVLKAGGAYVPLAADYPRERLAYMVADSNISILLTQTELLDRLPQGEQVICLDRDWPTISDFPTGNPLCPAVSDNAAYVIYTSGSTGAPKGVLVSHRNICNLVLAQIESFALAPDCRCLQFAAFSFDAAVSEIFTTLLSGATLVLAPAEALLPGDEFVALLQREAITTITLPPSALLLLDGGQLPALKTVVSAGEACRWEVAERWASGRRLLNFYGPTEATVGCCYERVDGRRDEAVTVPIGRPIDNMRLYVLDADDQLVPPGVAGELVVGGVGVARGYLNRPGLTAEKFVPDPFSGEAGSRLYRTGDRVRYRHDGRLEFLGRSDQQVKLRGFRIELGEIEAVLGRHPDVGEAAVILRQESDGRKQMAAYFIPAGTAVPTLQGVREFISARLPDYMMPAVFTPLDAWPLTPNGKVDRQALAVLAEPRMQPEQRFVAPGDEIEEMLAAIWAALLRLEKVGVHDNFFELGGDSILSIQMVAAARERGIYLNPRQIFQQQTIAELAAVAGTAPALEAEQGLVRGPVPLTPIQRWFFEQIRVEPHHWNQAVLLKTPERLELNRLAEAVAALVAHHDGLRLRFTRAGDGWQQAHAEPDDRELVDYRDLAGLPAHERKLALAAHAGRLQSSFDLTTGPLLKVAYFDFGTGVPGRLLFVAHHLVVDGVSWRILLADFQTVYGQLQRGTAVSLPTKTTAFKKWAIRLNEYARSAAVLANARYWLDQRYETAVTLPVDMSDGANANTEASRCSIEKQLDSETTRILLQDISPVYNTQINDVLLTALVQSCAEWTGRSSLLVDLEGHGREPIADELDLSRTVGWFTTLYPVHLQLEPEAAPGEALKAIKEQLRAVPAGGLSYGLLRYLSPDKALADRLADLPQAQVGFNYLGQIATADGFALALEPAGRLHSPHAPRRHLVEVDSQVVDGQLQLTWHYSERVHRAETIEQLAERFLARLCALIAHCQAPEAGGYTPSDFPEAALDQQGLDNVLAELDGLF